MTKMIRELIAGWDSSKKFTSNDVSTALGRDPNTISKLLNHMVRKNEIFVSFIEIDQKGKRIRVYQRHFDLDSSRIGISMIDDIIYRWMVKPLQPTSRHRFFSVEPEPQKT